MGTLGNAHATPSMDLAKRKELGQGYFGKYRKKSGVVEADRRAAQIIKENAEKELASIYQGKHPANTPLGSAHATASLTQARRNILLHGERTGGSDAYKERWEKLYENLGKKSGVVEAEKRAAQIIKENAEKELASIYQGKHPANTPLGDAHATPSMDLAKRKELGQGYFGKYRKKSGVIEADKRAAQIIKENESDYLKKLGKEGKKINWAKWGKWGAVALGAAALIGLGIWGVKKYRENQEEQANNAQAQQPINNVEQPDSTATGAVIPPIGVVPGDSTVVGINPPVAPAEPDTPAVEPTPVHNPNSVVDQDGNMTVKKGDGLWHIAKRYIEEKYANEPEKYENLSKAEQDKLIWKEVHRIAELNDFELVTKFINGKEVIVTSPMIHAGDKVKVVETETLAA